MVTKRKRYPQARLPLTDRARAVSPVGNAIVPTRGGISIPQAICEGIRGIKWSRCCVPGSTSGRSDGVEPGAKRRVPLVSGK